MNQENNYHISFFKPTTPRAKFNRNLVIWLVSIWAVAIFGFHFVLKIIEKPTPEPELITFRQVWPNVKQGNASQEEIKLFAQSTLHVAGKVFISTEHRDALDNGISWAVMQLADSSQQAAIHQVLDEFKIAAEKADLISNQEYVKAKRKLGALVQPLLGLDPDHILNKILPLELRSEYFDNFSDANKEIVETCMPVYTIHYRSILTDTTFLGFPFHYFYTAVFLLILFIGLCWIYCYRIDKYNKSIELAD